MPNQILYASPLAADCSRKTSFRFRVLVTALLLTLLCPLSPLSAQDHLTLELTEESELLNQLVLCGESDVQTVIFQTSGNETGTRADITATLNLFPYIKFAELLPEGTTPGVLLLDDSDSARPVFGFPDMNPESLNQVKVRFSVTANCDILDTITQSADLRILDEWTLAYQYNQQNYQQVFSGAEYKDALAVPNLNIEAAPIMEVVRTGDTLTRRLTVSNSGLNSYLEGFEYQLIQEPGAQIREIRINNIPVNFSSSVNEEGNEVITATAGGSYFIDNEIEFGQPGNQDERFDVDEILFIEERLEIVNCGNDGNATLSAVHQLSWGCDQIVCATEETSSTINIGVGEELIQFTFNDGTQNASYCEDGSLSITIANNGFEFDDDFATIFNLKVGIGFAVGTEFLTTSEGFKISSITLPGGMMIDNPDNLVSLTDLPALSVDPDGPGGLEDADGDGFFDDLRVNQSFELKAAFSIECQEDNQIDIDNNCDNDFRANFDGKIIYDNACNLNQEVLFDNFYRSFNTGTTTEICTDPDAFNDQDQFRISYFGERRTNNFSRACEGGDQVIVRLTLPENIQLSDRSSFQQDTTQYFPDFSQNEQEVTLTFDATDFNLNNDYALNLDFITQCANLGPTFFPVEIFYYCPECDCVQQWYCGVLEGAVLHASGQPCAEFICETGIQATNFNVERTTFGYTDDSFTVPFNPAEANKSVALACDSVQMILEAQVGNQQLADSAFLVITHGNANETDSDIPSFLFSKGTVTIQSGGNTRICELDTSDLTIITGIRQHQMRFLLGDCLVGNPLNPGDQITFRGNFAVNAAGPIPTNTFKKVPGFRASGAAIIDGVEYDQCDSYGSLFRLAKLNTTFSGPANGSFPNGCDDASLTYTLTKSINANAMREFFGEEQRQAVQVDSFLLEYDPELPSAFYDLSVEYRIQGREWQELPPLTSQSAGNYAISFEQLNTISTITGSNQVFQVRMNMLPGCESGFGSSSNDNLYALAAQMNFSNRYFAADNGNDDACVNYRVETDERQMAYEDAPTFSMEGIKTNVTTAERTFQWEIEHCNTSFLADAGLTWLELETAQGNVSILTIEDISDPEDIDTLDIQSIAGQNNRQFAFASGLLRRGANANPIEICNTFRITARLDSCQQSQVIAKSGWDCRASLAENWTPDHYPPCDEKRLLLQAEVLEPFVAASFQEEVSNISGFLCDTSTMVILVRNEEVGNLYDLRSRITLPRGATLVPGSIGFAYPSSSEFVPVTTNPVLVNENDEGKVYEYANFGNLNNFLHQNGIPAFDIDQPDSSEFRLRYQFVANCEFQNGELNRYDFQGYSACGDLSNRAFAETSPIIFAIDPTIARVFDFDFAVSPPLTPEEESTITIDINNIGNNSTDNDSLEVVLSEGINYIPQSASGSWITGEPVIATQDNRMWLRWRLPVGLQGGESATLRFRVSSEALVCDSLNTAQLSATSLVSFDCQIDGTDCLYEFVSSERAEFVITSDCDNSCVLSVGTVEEEMLIPNCEDSIFYCLNPYRPDDIEAYQFTDNGQPVNPETFIACDFRQVCIYTYFQIAIRNSAFRLDSWTVDGITYSGDFENVNQLADSMNVWNAGGNWEVLADVFILQGGHLNTEYSRMEITFPDTGERSFLGYDTRLTPFGTGIQLDTGFHQLVITDSLGCTDTFNINVLQQGSCTDCTAPLIQNIVTQNTFCEDATGIIKLELDQPAINYNFSWTPDLGTSDFLTPNIRTGLPVGGYSVKISERTDSLCFIEEVVFIENADTSSQITINTQPSQCQQGTGSAILTPPDYDYVWSDGGIGNDRDDLLPGIYQVTFTNSSDTNSCENVILVAIAEENNLEVTHEVITRPFCRSNNGAVRLLVAGGSGQYTTDFPGGGLVDSNLTAGIYIVQITDQLTGCHTTYEFVLENEVHKSNIEIISINNPSCPGEADGAVNFNVTYEDGFRFPAETIITDGINSYPPDSLPAGDYLMVITDQTGCTTGSHPFSVISIAPLDVRITTSESCAEETFASIAVTGGTPGYNIAWADLSEPASTGIRTDLPDSSYQLTVTDAQGCEVLAEVLMPQCPCIAPAIENILTTPTYCGEDNGRVIIQLEENTNLTYEIIPDTGLQGATPNIFTNLPPGNYEVRVTDPLASECFSSETFTIAVEARPPFTVLENQIIPAECGKNNGSVVIDIEESIEDFTTRWIPDAGSSDSISNARANLPAGVYQAIFSYLGSETCSDTVEIEIPEVIFPDLEMEITRLDSASCGQNNGAVVLSLSPDSLDWVVLWPESAGVSTDQFQRSNLAAGQYDLTVTLSGDTACQLDYPLIIPDQYPEATIVEVDTVLTTFDDCAMGTGTATIELGEEENPSEYTFVWTPDNGATGQEPNQRTGLSEGNYTVEIFKPAQPQCASIIEVTIEGRSLETSQFRATTTPSSCGAANGSAIITTTIGDMEDYTVRWPDDIGVTEAGVRTQLPAGTYDLVIALADAPSCTVEFSVTIDEDTTPPFSLIETLVTPATCGNNNGTVALVLSPDTLQYSISWLPNEPENNLSDNSITELAAGDYQIIVRLADNDLCADTFDITIPGLELEVETTVFPSKCDAPPTGTVVLTPSSYTYQWPDGFVGNSRNELFPDTYAVTVTSSEIPDCELVMDVTVEVENGITAEAVVNNLPSCGAANGSVTLEVSGGSGNYTFSWDSETNTNNRLLGGDYQVTIIDVDLSCQSVTSFILDTLPYTPLNLMITDTFGISCTGNNDGRINFSVNSGSPVTDTLITDFAGDSYQNGQLPAGNYCLEVTDEQGCTSERACFTIQDVSPLLIEYMSTAACLDTGKIDLTITGGTAPYQVNWLDLEGTNNEEDRSQLDSGTYQVVVQDANLCQTDTFAVQVGACEECILPADIEVITNNSNCNSPSGTLTLLIDENPADYGIRFIPEVEVEQTGALSWSGFPEGSFIAQITYLPNGECFTTIDFTIYQPDFADFLPITSPAECGLPNGQALLGPAGYTYTWEDGFTSDQRTDLASGFYQITVEDTLSGCDSIFTIVVEEDNLMEFKVAINNLPTCGNQDGSVTLDINGGSGDYSFEWQDGTTSATNENLTAGSHRVLVTDNLTGCRLPVLFALQNGDAADVVTINILETGNASCPLSADGYVRYSVETSGEASINLDTLLNNGFTNFKPNQLPAGNYCIAVKDSMQCVLGTTCFEIEAPAPMDITVSSIPQCEEGGVLSVNVAGGTEPYTYSWGGIEVSGNLSEISDLPKGTYSLTVTDAVDCQAVVEELVVDTCQPCPLILGSETLRYSVADCDASLDICLPYSLDPDKLFIVEQDGIQLDLFDIDGCEEDSVASYSYSPLLEQGRLTPYSLNSWTANGQEFSGAFMSLEELVDSMNVWDAGGNWRFDPHSPQIIGGTMGGNYGNIEVELLVNPGNESVLEVDYKLFQQGIKVNLGVGAYEFTIQDPITFCEDTLLVLVDCATTDTTRVVIIPEQMDTSCLTTEELIGSLDTTYIDCGDGPKVDVRIEEDSCIILTGVEVGVDTVCVITCDEYEICDTAIIIVEVHYDTIFDTIIIDEEMTFCLDPNGVALEGTPISMQELCRTPDEMLVKYEFDAESLCFSYTSPTIGQELACIEVCDDLGFCDTLDFSVMVINDPPDHIEDTIFIGETVTYCFNTLALPGEIDFFENNCADSSGMTVDYFLDPINYCVEYGGIDVGNEPACIVICDNLGNCDTATFDITVIEYLDLPVAVDDYDTTDLGVPIVLDIRANDIPFGVGEDGFTILEEPAFGDLLINLDGSVTYFEDEFCERSDQFTYELCNDFGCDTATVHIYIRCLDIVVFTAVSPNGDGKNDVFFISDIEKFPNSELTIYNRWGNIVYRATNYQNDWNGTWKGNQELPNGTYFYRLSLNESNDNRIFEGYLELRR